MINKDFKLKEILMAILGVFIIVLIFYFGVKSFNEMDNISDQKNTISVSGKGEIFIKPDIAKVSVSVEKNAYSVSDVQNQATNAINNVTKFLKDSGIEDKDIKTVNYSIYPRYDYLESQGRVFRGYIVSQTLEIKVRKIEDTGKILAGVISVGANQVGGVSFTIDDEEGVKRQARQKAINDAREKAKQLSKDLGVRMGRLINYSEGGNNWIPSPYTTKESALGMGGGEIAPEIPIGENKVTINVNLVYQIK